MCTQVHQFALETDSILWWCQILLEKGFRRKIKARRSDIMFWYHFNAAEPFYYCYGYKTNS